jgi:ABC-type transporter Mla maintaining outer membrane lipid asymmetry permease subunit MlaE
MQYSDDDVPQAVFQYDLSPIAVSLQRKGKRWYEFLTSLCAIIGGTFTVVGLVSSFLGIVFKPKKL